MPSLASRVASLTLLLLFSRGVAHAQSAALPDCEWCGAQDAPTQLGSALRLAPASESGTPLEITGMVYARDGHSPAPGVLLYVYHTDATGVYPMRGDETGNGRRHGYLRGWLRTDASGHYQIATIRPAPYRTRTGPAHIHMTVTPPDGTESWIESIVFDDDPLLTPLARAQRTNKGGSGIVRPITDARGMQHVVRDIVMEH